MFKFIALAAPAKVDPPAFWKYDIGHSPSSFKFSDIRNMNFVDTPPYLHFKETDQKRKCF